LRKRETAITPKMERSRGKYAFGGVVTRRKRWKSANKTGRAQEEGTCDEGVLPGGHPSSSLREEKRERVSPRICGIEGGKKFAGTSTKKKGVQEVAHFLGRKGGVGNEPASTFSGSGEKKAPH